MTTHFHRQVTLIEMVLVLVILIALTGVAITIYPNLAPRAALTGTAASIRELNNTIILLETVTTGAMPNDLDSMLFDPDGPAVSTNVVELRLPPPAAAAGVAPASVATIMTTLNAVAGPGIYSPDDLMTAFNNKGLTTLQAHTGAAPPADGHETFAETTTRDIEVAAAGTAVATLLTMPTPISGPPLASDEVLIVFGVGSESSWVDSFTATTPGLQAAPVYQSEVPIFNDAQLYYSRFGLVYKVKGNTPGTGGIEITYVRAIAFAHDGVNTLDIVNTKLAELDN